MTSDHHDICSHRWSASGPRCCLPAGHDGSHLYRCSDPRCPGLEYPASAMAHRHGGWAESDDWVEVPEAGPDDAPAELAGDPARVEWPDWLTDEAAAELRNLEQNAELAISPYQPERVRAAGRRVRSSLRALRHSAVRPPERAWPQSISSKAVEALELIEASAARGAVETFAAPRPWGAVAAAMRQIRQDLVELDAALEEIGEFEEAS